MVKLLLDRYRIIAPLGEGGASTVFLAWDQRIARRVAIKSLALSGSQAAQAGLQEARIAALLQHPHIVQVLDFEQVAGARLPAQFANDAQSADATIAAANHAYLIMEYLEGITLADVPSEDLDADLIAAIIDAIGGALAFAHENGVLHLDVKPGNILIDRNGQIKLADFGLSLLSDSAGKRRALGGTLGYMPLEQLQGLPATAATDQWALAAVLYELCTDEYPYYNEIERRPSLARMRAAQEAGEAPLLELGAPGLTAVFARALARDPQERYGSVAELCAELRGYFGDSAQGTRALAALACELSGDNEGADGALGGAPEEELRQRALDARNARLQRRAQRRQARPLRGALGWLALLLSLLAVLSAALALSCLLAPGLFTQLFGDKRLVVSAGSTGFFILVCILMLLTRAALRRRN